VHNDVEVIGESLVEKQKRVVVTLDDPGIYKLFIKLIAGELEDRITCLEADVTY